MTAGTRERLNRHLARRGIASRRGADALIAGGRVLLNGAPAGLGATVAAGDRVVVDGRCIPDAPAAVTLLLNKPPGVVTTRRDPQHRPTVMDLVPNSPGLAPVGRLDVDSRGLLLLTNDGELAHRVGHPRFGLRRIYRARVTPTIDDAALRALLDGVILEDGAARALAARSTAAGNLLELVMGEGRRREVRRMCAAVGLEVLDLQRVGYGPLRLGSLGEGQARPLRPAELAALRSAVGLAGGGAG